MLSLLVACSLCFVDRALGDDYSAMQMHMVGALIALNGAKIIPAVNQMNGIRDSIKCPTQFASAKTFINNSVNPKKNYLDACLGTPERATDTQLQNIWNMLQNKQVGVLTELASKEGCSNPAFSQACADKVILHAYQRCNAGGSWSDSYVAQLNALKESCKKDCAAYATKMQSAKQTFDMRLGLLLQGTQKRDQIKKQIEDLKRQLAGLENTTIPMLQKQTDAAGAAYTALQNGRAAVCGK